MDPLSGKNKQWQEPLINDILSGNNYCFGILSKAGKWEFKNPAIEIFLQKFSEPGIINPEVMQFFHDQSEGNVFEGFLTFGDKNNAGISIFSRIIKNQGFLYIYGGVDLDENVRQNIKLNQLNIEVIDLERNLIKEKKRLEATLNILKEKNEKLERINREKDTMLTVLSHDLKNPFNSILGFASILRNNIREYPLDKTLKFIDYIHSSAEQTYSLLQNLLFWINSQNGTISINKETLALDELIKNVIASLSSTAQLKNIKFKFETPLNQTIEGDPNLMLTIFRNIAHNAIKFTNSGGEIKIYYTLNANEVKISVEDNGKGMSDEMLSAITEYKNVQSTQGTSGEKGTGFGLSLIYKFVEIHGGRIHIESKETIGTTFSVILPK